MSQEMYNIIKIEAAIATFLGFMLMIYGVHLQILGVTTGYLGIFVGGALASYAIYYWEKARKIIKTRASASRPPLEAAIRE